MMSARTKVTQYAGVSSASSTSSWRQVIPGPRAGEGEKFPSKDAYFDNTPHKPAAPKKPTPLVFPYLPWIVVGVEKVAICLEWSGTPE